MSKAKIRKTGEVVDVIYFRCSTIRNICDEVSYIDSKGIEHEGENLNYYWDFENIPNSDAIIDWEQRRYEIAKEQAMESEWIEIGDKHYCPDCYELDDELDEYVPKKKGDK